MMVAVKRATYQDILDLPAHEVGQIIDGELVVQPRPATPHAGAASSLDKLLGGPFQFGRGGPGGWFIVFEPELHFGEDVLVPDLAGWRRERMPELPNAPHLTLAPDWVCEILSPSTAKLDRTKKLPLYARQGVRHAWIVDPLERTLEVLRLENGRWSILGSYADDVVVRAEPFEAIELSLRMVFTGSP